MIGESVEDRIRDMFLKRIVDIGCFSIHEVDRIKEIYNSSNKSEELIKQLLSLLGVEDED